MISYVKPAQVKERLQSSYSGADDVTLADMIGSCSAFLDKHCQRSSGGFNVQTYDELYNGTGDSLLFLNNVPLVSISRIATTMLPCMSIHNVDSDMGCRATCSVTSTGLTLTYVKSAVTTTNTLLWATYPTVSQLVAAVNGVGNNWTAQVMGGFGTWSSADLRATQGAFGARIVTAYLWIHWMELSLYRVNELTGEIWSPQGFARGVFNWRCSYSAGYTAFPDDLTQALCELVAQCYYIRQANSNMASEGIGPLSYSRLTNKAFDGLSDMAKKTISYYKRRPIQHFSTW